MGLTQLDLGQPVYFTHRAVVYKDRTGLQVRARGERRKVYELFKPFEFYKTERWPRRAVYGKPELQSLSNFVLVYPEDGRGIVTGLTFRSEGVYREGRTPSGGWDSESEYEQAYLTRRSASRCTRCARRSANP